MPEGLTEKLERLAGADVGVVRRDEPLREHCTWRIGGPADLLIEPQRIDQVAALLRLLSGSGTPSVIVGGGSNLLFSDAGVRGVVVKIGRALSGLAVDGTTVRAEAGIAVPRLARAAALAGLTGIEHTIGIPGTLGGLIVMNGGSQRKGIGEVIRTVRAVDSTGEVRRMGREECGFAYRTSAFQGSDLTVVEAEMVLRRGDPDRIRQESLEILRTRRRKFPRRQPNCGSVFMTHPELYERHGPPGKVLDEMGCKGWRVGDAEVSGKHANFIVNLGAARAADVLELIGRLREAVHAKTGIWLKCEVKFVRQDGRVMPADDASEARPGGGRKGV